jgi:hypothetical protein
MKQTAKANWPEKAARLVIRAALAFPALLLVLTAPLHAADRPAHGHTAPGAGLPFAIYDFDGDNKPDLAQVHAGGTAASSTHYSIDFELSTGSRQSIELTAPSGGLRLESRDVNGDQFPDLVVTTSWTEQPVAVLLNDGRGNFKSLDASVFPNAFETSDTSVDHPLNPEGDGAAAVFPRTSPGESKETGSTHTARDALGCVECRPGQFPSIPAREGFFGRAPPAFLD